MSTSIPSVLRRAVAVLAGGAAFSLGACADVVAFEGLPAEANRYTLEATTDDVTTAWEYTSDRPTERGTDQVCLSDLFSELETGQCRPEPLIFLRYDLGLGLDTRVRSGPPHRIDVTAYYEDRLDPAPQVTELAVAASFDGGQSWQPVPTRATGENSFAATVHHPADAESVGLRVNAVDSGGNTVVQNIPQAYLLSG